ncbi:MAG: FecR family protein [Chryseobacterium sp.]|nr:FecR family protein [Chryseobacterium sp.]
MEEKDNQLPHFDNKEDREIWEDILNNPVKSLTPEKENHFFENLYRKIDTYERKKKLRRLRIYSTVAATIMLAIAGLIGYNATFKPDVYLAKLQNSEIKLADGSVVILAQGGKLTVEKSFPADTRDVFLEGNAVFHVAKSKEHPFIVHGKGYETKVLGTVFKVTQDGKTFNVDLYEGKVMVYQQGRSKEPIVLKPQQTFSNLGLPQVASVTQTVDKKSAPIKDKSAAFTFDKCPISDVVKVIEKTYGITLHYPEDLENAKITLSLPNATAEALIQSLAIQLNLNIKQKNDSIFELEK